jgi:para-aminobenzoate synthetase/4-amino-4-deoxychorismate lyase
MPAPVPDAMMLYVVSPTRLDSSDAFLFHKTTRRELYDQEWKHYSDTVGADEVIYLNERGELAEGSRTNIFIDRGDGVLVTPPLPAGLLPGSSERSCWPADGRSKAS